MNILITGGASGLGEAITQKLAADARNKVYFTYSKSHSNALKLTQQFTNTVSVKCNFELAEDVTALCNTLGDLNMDVLINNAYAGAYLKTYFHKIATPDFLQEFQNNVLPVLAITQAAINNFRKKKAGKIITISTAALVGSPPIGTSAYVANKAYLEVMSKCWAAENNKFHITSNLISPAFMLTDFTSGFDERIVEQLIEAHPLKRLLTKEEVAEAVSFLITTEEQINGMNFILNAGETISSKTKEL